MFILQEVWGGFDFDLGVDLGGILPMSNKDGYSTILLNKE